MQNAYTNATVIALGEACDKAKEAHAAAKHASDRMHIALAKWSAANGEDEIRAPFADEAEELDEFLDLSYKALLAANKALYRAELETGRS